MKILSECNMALMLAELQAGKTFILPTETSYGLCCDATNPQAIERIFKIKGRRPDKPLLVVVPTVAMARELVAVNPLFEKFATEHWPGPLTIVSEYNVSSRYNLPLGVIGKDGTVAVRVTTSKLLGDLSTRLGRPLVATSGNISGTGDHYDSAAVAAQFTNRDQAPDYLFEAGTIPVRPPTTIISVVHNSLKIIRQGEIIIAQ